MNCEGSYNSNVYTRTLQYRVSKEPTIRCVFDQMQMRRTRQYPPYYYVVLVTVSHPELLKAVQVTEKIVGHLRSHCSQQTMVLGPVASAIQG